MRHYESNFVESVTNTPRNPADDHIRVTITELGPNDTCGTGKIPAFNRSKRIHFKKWLRENLKPTRDSSNENEDVTVDENDDLLFIPKFTFEIKTVQEDPVSPRQALHKLKEFMKARMKRTTNSGERYEGKSDEESPIKQPSPKQYNSPEHLDIDDQMLSEELKCYNQFKSDEQQLITLFESTMRSSKNFSKQWKEPSKELASIDILNCEDFQALKNRISELPVCFSAMSLIEDEESCELKRHLEEELTPSNESKRIRVIHSPFVEYLDREVMPEILRGPDSVDESPPELVDSVGTSTLSSCSEDSMGKTPPSVLTRSEANNKEKEKETNVESNRRSSIVDRLMLAIKGSHASALHVSPPQTPETARIAASTGGSNSSNSSKSGFEPTHILIPTFRRRDDQMDVSGIVKNIASGIITERELMRLSAKRQRDITFKSEEFYNTENKESCSSFEESGERKAQEDQDMTDGSVKFNKFSYLLVYDASKKCKYDNAKDCLSIKIPQYESSTHDSGYEGDDDDGYEEESETNGGVGIKSLGKSIKSKINESTLRLAQKHLSLAPCSKPILKSKDNEKAEQELSRAANCDGVDIFSFLSFFERHERKRMEAESNLERIREKQLTRYYSSDFFPELEDIQLPVTDNAEFSKSKRATEFNIGRKLNDHRIEVANYPCSRYSEKVDHETPNSQKGL